MLLRYNVSLLSDARISRISLTFSRSRKKVCLIHTLKTRNLILNAIKLYFARNSVLHFRLVLKKKRSLESTLIAWFLAQVFNTSSTPFLCKTTPYKPLRTLESMDFDIANRIRCNLLKCVAERSSQPITNCNTKWFLKVSKQFRRIFDCVLKYNLFTIDRTSRQSIE